jgi:NADH-quinone oxidoreductase subunit E
MLSEDEIREIREEMAHYPTARAGAVEALKIVQRSRRWVSDESLADISALTGLPVAELENVATFYNLIFREPVGKHVIHICDSVSCWVMGYENLRDHLCEQLGVCPGETSEDGLFTLVPIQCLGICENAPAMMVDEELYVNLDVAKIDEILDSYR